MAHACSQPDCQVCDGQGGVLDGDADQDGICDDDEVPGCTDELAWNYNDPSHRFR